MLNFLKWNLPVDDRGQIHYYQYSIFNSFSYISQLFIYMVQTPEQACNLSIHIFFIVWSVIDNSAVDPGFFKGGSNLQRGIRFVILPDYLSFFPDFSEILHENGIILPSEPRTYSGSEFVVANTLTK